jgi:maleate isomerase
VAAPIRLGILVPSSNTCLEPVAAAMLSPLQSDVSLHAGRVGVTRIGLSPEELAPFEVEEIFAAARLLADAQVSVIAWGGTSASWLGVDRDRDLCRRIETELGVPATTATLALLEAFQSFGIQRYGLAVPYTTDVTERIVDTYGREGFQCGRRAELGLSENVTFDQVPPERIRDLVGEAAPGCDGVAVVCTNLRAGPLVEELESSLGIPIVDSVIATVSKCLELAHGPAVLHGWGKLASSRP